MELKNKLRPLSIFGLDQPIVEAWLHHVGKTLINAKIQFPDKSEYYVTDIDLYFFKEGLFEDPYMDKVDEQKICDGWYYNSIRRTIDITFGNNEYFGAALLRSINIKSEDKVITPTEVTEIFKEKLKIRDLSLLNKAIPENKPKLVLRNNEPIGPYYSSTRPIFYATTEDSEAKIIKKIEFFNKRLRFSSKFPSYQSSELKLKLNILSCIRCGYLLEATEAFGSDVINPLIDLINDQDMEKIVPSDWPPYENNSLNNMLKYINEKIVIR